MEVVGHLIMQLGVFSQIPGNQSIRKFPFTCWRYAMEDPVYSKFIFIVITTPNISYQIIKHLLVIHMLEVHNGGPSLSKIYLYYKKYTKHKLPNRKTSFSHCTVSLSEKLNCLFCVNVCPFVCIIY